MDRLHQMRVFVAVADESGFAAAARRLGMSAPAVTRAVASLEQTLGVKLIKRTTRHLRVTEAGYRYLHDVRRILDEVAAADEAAAGLDATPRGRLAITAPVMFGRMFVLPGVVDYLRRYPQMQVDTVFLDRVVSLLEEGLDVGVRIGEIPDSSMRAIRVGQVRMMLVASPAYLEQHGQPETLEQLNQHTLIASRAGNFSNHWRLGNPGNERLVRIEPRLTVTTNDAAVSAAQQGLGVTRAISYQVADELESGTLKSLLTDCTPPPLPIHIAHRDDRNPPAKVRAFIDLLADKLRNDPALMPSLTNAED
ncbi:LysR family transcriptional regulator [Motiliproteus sp.]|uniref:LysR family transcriptional regulator n=1 Tax=Motiliproteus sp. TaxID=1898955 RepID=UPI003BA9510F